MISFFNKWAIVNTAELSETFFQSDAVIEALEREKSQLAKTIASLQAEVSEKKQTIENQDKQITALLDEVSGLQQEVYDLTQEVLQLQKTTFAELPKPEKPRGGRPRKTTIAS